PPQVSASAIRVVGTGLGANGSELRPFNESPGTVVVLSIQAPRGSGIVEIDDHGSKLDAFSDDKGQTLLEEGRVGPFPKVAEDGSAALVDVQVRGRPSAGAVSVTVQGSIAMTLAGGSKPVRAAGVRLDTGQTFKIGTTTMTIGEAKVEDESTKLTFGLPRSVLNTIREVRFFDAKNAPIEGRRAGSGYFNEKATLEYEAKTKDKTMTIEFELWQNSRAIKVPFTVQVGLGVAAGARSSGSGDAPAAPKTETADKVEKAPGPPPVITATDGAASVDAVVKQLQTAALAGKGAQMLSVIYPTERGAFGQGVAMALAFLPMASMDDPKAGEQVQKDLDVFFDKHKLKPPFVREPADLFQGIDLPAFISDAMIFIKSHAKKGENPASMLPVPSGRAENVQITGESAVATLSGKEIKFTRISGRWFIRLE
ncbi:MAG TPA: hypothetical protein VF921_00805, partial [Vicinamibacterales bacterium]